MSILEEMGEKIWRNEKPLNGVACLCFDSVLEK